MKREKNPCGLHDKNLMLMSLLNFNALLQYHLRSLGFDFNSFAEIRSLKHKKDWENQPDITHLLHEN